MLAGVGGRTVAEAKRRLTIREFRRWQAFAAVEPFGEERADLRMAIGACVNANIHRAKNQKAFKPGDFMPRFGVVKKAQSAKEQVALLKAFAAAHNQSTRAKRS